MNKQVLIIDDDDDDCDLLCDAINVIDSGIECKRILSGEKAITFLQSLSFAPDFIFLDINMPIFGGKRCLTEITKIESLSKVPVIMYTTSKRNDDKAWSYELGAVHFITKPTSFKELCSQIDFVLQNDWQRNNQLS